MIARLFEAHNLGWSELEKVNRNRILYAYSAKARESTRAA